MSTVTIVSGYVPKSVSLCRVEEMVMAPSSAPDPSLFPTTKVCKPLPIASALAQLKASQSGGGVEAGRWKYITFFLAFSSPWVESIAFLPANFSDKQKLFATRGCLEEDLTLSKYQSFWQGRELRSLNNFAGLEAQQIETAKNIVGAFSHDELTDAISVTFKNMDKTDTYNWAKKLSFQ